MDITTERIKKHVESYHVVLSNGLSFWAPYLINYNHSQDNSVPRGLGKSTADEIRLSAEYIISLYPDIDAESLREKLTNGSLPDMSMNYKGIDCSGFVFHVYNQMLRDTYNIDFTTLLSVPKNQVINGAFNFDEWKACYKLTEEEASSLPENVPMDWVVRTFKRKPAGLCNVASLVSSYSSTRIPSMDKVEIGDLVHMVIPGDITKHIGIITELHSTHVKIAHSGRSDPSEIGGVMIENVQMTEKIETMQLATPREFLGVYRLKVSLQ